MQIPPVVWDLFLIALVLVIAVEARIVSGGRRFGLSNLEIVFWVLITPVFFLLPLIPFLLRIKHKRRELEEKERRELLP